MGESPPPSGSSDPSMDDLPVADAVNLQKEQSMVKIDKEIEFRVDLFNGLVKTCFSKCIDRRYKEPELYIGENSCLDRCVAKYSQVINVVGQILASRRPEM